MRAVYPIGSRCHWAVRRGQDPSLRYKAVRLQITQNRGRGMPRPYRAVYPIGSRCRWVAGGLPNRFALPLGSKEGSRPLPTIQSRKVAGYANTRAGHAPPLPCGFPVGSIYWGGCGGRHICRPYKPTRKFFISIRSRAGHAPPAPCDDFTRPAIPPDGGAWCGCPLRCSAWSKCGCNIA